MKTFLFASLLGFSTFLACGEEEKETRTEPEGANPGECSDGADNDFDGDYDCNDADCSGSPDCLESDCDDGADNDQDGDFDCDDSDCADAPECATENDCSDGADNDADGLFDCDDPDCAEDAACVDDFEGDEAGECTDGVDNDSDGFVDCDDPNCEGSPDCESSIGIQSNPGLSCKDILEQGGSIGDGEYWIDPAGTGAFEVYCDMTTDGGGWSILVDLLGYPSTNITSSSDYQDYCDDLGMIYVGRGVDSPEAWLAQKRMLWSTNHALKQSGWPTQDAQLLMPIIGGGQKYTIYDNVLAILPPNIEGDHCDRSTDHLCGYWFSSGWSHPDLNGYPDPEDWDSDLNRSTTYVSCIFR